MGDKDTIPALERAIELIEAVAGGMHHHSIAELGRELGIPATTCYRVVRTLMDADWLRPRGRGAGYELSFGLAPLLKPFESQRVLIHAIEPFVAEMVEATGLSAKLSVISGHQAVTVHRVNSDRPIALTGRVGVGFHLAHGSSGAALLSTMKDAHVQQIIDAAPQTVWAHQQPEQVWERIAQCRDRGCCLDLGGYKPHIHTLSGPIGDATHPAAALTLLGMPGDFSQLERDPITDIFTDTLRRSREALGAHTKQDEAD